MTLDFDSIYSLNYCDFLEQKNLERFFADSWIDLTFSSASADKSDSIFRLNPSSYTRTSSSSAYLPQDPVYYDGEKILKIQSIVQRLQESVASFQTILNGDKAHPLKDKCVRLLGSQFDPALIKLQSSTLSPISQGVSGSYFWNEGAQNPQFIVKPLDEDAGCINNPKGYVSLDVNSFVRDFMPLYKSSIKEGFVYELAKEFQLDQIAPKTALMIIESSDFSSYILQQLQNQEVDGRFLDDLQQISRRKLCSVQDFIPEAQSLFDVVEKSNYLFMIQELTAFYSLLGLDIGCVPSNPDQTVFLEKLMFLALKFLEIQAEFSKIGLENSLDSELQNQFFLLKQVLLLFSLESQGIVCSSLSGLQDDLIDECKLNLPEISQTNINEFYRIVQKAFVEKTPLTTNEICWFEAFFSRNEISNAFKLKFLKTALQNIEKELLNKITEMFKNFNVDEFSGSENHRKFVTEFASYFNNRSKWYFDCFFTNKPLDRDDFEETNILIWTSFDTDAHLGNILCYEKQAPDGSNIYGLKKIDNGLTFPSENKGLRNNLKYHRYGFDKLSLKSREKILNIDEDLIVERMKFYGLDYAEDAFRKRIEMLKKLASNPDLTIRDIDSMLEKAFK